MLCLKKSLPFCYLRHNMYGIEESEVILIAETYSAHRECVAIIIFPLAVAYTPTLSELITPLFIVNTCLVDILHLVLITNPG